MYCLYVCRYLLLRSELRLTFVFFFRKVARDDADIGAVSDLVLIGGYDDHDRNVVFVYVALKSCCVSLILICFAAHSGDNGSFPNLDALRTTIEIFNVTSRTFLSPYTISLPRRNIEVACTSFVW